ncbi:FRAS1-related extracellular matrix protein 1-like [Strigops habroptila]|nr:FRAS1-related extracellular matrix protein 1-like [Strigops habroptila]
METHIQKANRYGDSPRRCFSMVLSPLCSSLISNHFWKQSENQSLFTETSHKFSLLQRCNQKVRSTQFLLQHSTNGLSDARCSKTGDIVLLAKPVTLTEGDRVTLTTDVPVATDGTSKPEKLLYAVSLPPVHGQIEHINYPGVPISSYSQLDVVAQKVSDVHDNSHGAGKESVR